MSHDIRTPMNAIIGFTTLAISNIDDKDRVKDYLTKTLHPAIICSPSSTMCWDMSRN